jgi:hypothetical protein
MNQAGKPAAAAAEAQVLMNERREAGMGFMAFI